MDKPEPLVTNSWLTNRLTDRHTLSQKPFFFTQGVSKHGVLMRNGVVKFCINLIPSLMRM